MRVIVVSDSPVRSVVVSPDGRFVAACDRSGRRAVYDWATGGPVHLFPPSSGVEQLAFCPGERVACVHRGALSVEPFGGAGGPVPLPGEFAGGVAVSPDGRSLAAVTADRGSPSRLARWALPAARPQSGVEDWPPVRRLAFSPNGDYLAGIWSGARPAGRVQ